MTEERKRVLTDTIELLKYEISVDGRGVIEGGRVREAVQVGKKNLNVRKAYAPNGIYKIGWVYDFDVSYCMICMSEFGWFIRRHHCRACGYVVCGDCSKYKAKIGGLPEEVESRICCNCYQGNEITPGGRFSPGSSFNTSFDMDVTAKDIKQQKVVTDNLYSSPIENDLTRYQIKEQAQQKQAIEDFERSQARHYAHSYRVMRGIVPPDITSTNLSLMLRQGLPALVAKRVWTCGALWLICMHSDDIGKIHIADLRSRYATVGLDIVEMRAIWNILPKWSPDDPATAAKAEWRNNFKVKLDTLARAEMEGTISPEEKRHPVYEGVEPILVFNHRIPLDAKYDKIDTYGHVVYTGIDNEGNTTSIEFSEEQEEEKDDIDAKPAAAASPAPAESVVADSPEVSTPDTVAQSRTPGSVSPSAPQDSVSPVSRIAQLDLTDVRESSTRTRSPSTRGVSAGKYKEHLDGKAGEVPPPPPGGSAKASPRRRPPPLPATGPSGASPLVVSKKTTESSDAWLSTVNMPASPDSEPSSSPPPAAAPALFVPVIDPNADTPPSEKTNTWKPSENPAQRIGGGYGLAAVVADSDDEASRVGTPQKQGSTEDPGTPATGTFSPGASLSPSTPTLSPLVASSSFDTPVQSANPEFSLSEVKGMVLRGDAEGLNALFESGPVGSRSLRAVITPPMTESAASQLFMNVCREPSGVKDPKETLIILVKDFRADVNFVGSDGKSGLVALLLQPELATVVINLGGSILKKGKMTACPLSICLELSDQGILDGDWVIDAFERSTNFKSMSPADAREYFTLLIQAGRHVAAAQLIGLNRVQVSGDDASKLMKQCNFEAMKDSLETYELLEKLGGQF